MLKPKAIGSIVLIYALGMHLLSGIEGGLGVLGFLTNRIPYRVSNPYIFILVNLLSALYLLSYLAGGVGLILLRRWASLLVLMTGGVEFISGIVTLVSSFLGQQSTVPYQVLIYSGVAPVLLLPQPLPAWQCGCIKILMLG